MKKLIVSIIIVSMTFWGVGCSSKAQSELEVVQSKLNEANAKIEMQEGIIKELTNKLEVANQGTIERYMTNGIEQKRSVEISISYLPSFNEYDERMKEYQEKYKAEGKKVIYPSEPKGNRLFILKTNAKVKDVTLADYGNGFINDFGSDSERFFEKCGIDRSGNLVKELNPDEVLIFTAHESEGIPTCYFSWTEPDGRIIYNSVTYDGKGGKFKIE